MKAFIVALLLSSGISLYPNAGTVTEVDQRNDIVTFVDGVGMEWQFSGTEDWMVGDGIAVIMSDNGTEDIYDDMIVDQRYIWTE